MNEWKCRECDRPVSSYAHLRLGRAINKGSNALCLDCVDRLGPKMDCLTMHEFVPAYIRSVQTPRQANAATVRAMEDRIKRLEGMLTDPVALERLLEDVTSPNRGYRPNAASH